MTATTLKAINTRYAGHLFRSRLEARWAVFFDHLGISWEYEPEGYELPDGTRYLPDFRIAGSCDSLRWIEIKPSHVKSDPKFSAFEKALSPDGTDLSMVTWAALASGSPLEWLQSGNTFCPRCGEPLNEPLDEMLLCHHCDWETDCGGGHPWQNDGIQSVKWRPHKGWIQLHFPSHWGYLLKKAAVAAQSARFEHGQSGAL